MSDRYITVAIHTYEKAVALRALLESEGISVEFRNVNIEHPIVSSGVRVRIRETDLPLALRIIENREIFSMPALSADASGGSKAILVPVDFSDKSLASAVSAFTIAERHSTTIVLLHTYIDPYVAGNMQLTDSLTYEITDVNTRALIESTAKTQMRHFASRIKELIKKGQVPAVKFTTCVMEGVPEDAITEYCRSNNPSLIVMGTRGPKRKEADLIGSVTAEVLDKCRIPVLAIPEKDDIQPSECVNTLNFKNIICFCNSDQQDILALDALHRFFPKADAEVTIVPAPVKKRPFARNSRESLNAIRDYCENNFAGYKFVVKEIKDDDYEEGVRKLCREGQFDLLVIPNRKKNVFSRIFSPTLAHRILFSTERPMLVIPV